MFRPMKHKTETRNTLEEVTKKRQSAWGTNSRKQRWYNKRLMM